MVSGFLTSPYDHCRTSSGDAIPILIDSKLLTSAIPFPRLPLRELLLLGREGHGGAVHDSADLAAPGGSGSVAVVLFLIAEVDRVAFAVLDGDLEAERLQLVDQDAEALGDTGSGDR